MRDASSVWIKRHFTADSINEVVNEPSVYEWVHGPFEGHMDLTPLIADTHNVLLMGEFGGVMFIHHQTGLYEAHTQVMPNGRGSWTIKMVRAALHYMFTKTDAMEILTRVPQGNLGALTLVKIIHGVFQFRREQGWLKDGNVIPADVYALSVQDWMKSAPGLEERGHWFHTRLMEEYEKLGKTEPLHPDDANHDRYVGAAVDMMIGGQPGKAMVMYNRWAKVCGYQEISIVSESPLAIDIREAIIGVKNDDFWVMSCR